MSRYDIPLLVASALTFAIGCAHSYLGEKYILIRLFRRADLPVLFGGSEFTTRTLRLAWHLTTVSWWGAAIVFFAMAQAPISSAVMGSILGAVFLSSGIVTLI